MSRGGLEHVLVLTLLTSLLNRQTLFTAEKCPDNHTVFEFEGAMTL